MARFEQYLTFAGITVFVAYIGSILLPFRYDSGGRGLASGAVAATILLEIIWVLAGVSIAILRGSATSVKFRIILLMNSLVVCLVLWATFRS